MKSFALRLALLLLAAVVLAAPACAVRSPSIADLQYNPGRYYDRTVRIEGVVTSSWGAPLLPFRVYKVGDQTGEITVLSDRARVPGKGARVRVKGRLAEFATFGGRSIGTHIREHDLDVLRRY